MRVSSMRENRETPETPSSLNGEGRSEKAESRTSDMHVSGGSNDLIVPTKRANNAGLPAAEPVEGRGSAKGNALQAAAYRTQSRTTRMYRSARGTAGSRVTRGGPSIPKVRTV